MPLPVCLVCEDEALIAVDLEAALADAGLAVVGRFATSAEGLGWIEKSTAPDMALLDFRLGDRSCASLVQALRERSALADAVPFAWPWRSAGSHS